MDNADHLKEIRIDPVVPNDSVLISTARAQRPHNKEKTVPRDERDHVEKCPFCKGNEHMTPPQICAYPNSEDWSIRIVENLYPVLSDDRNGTAVTNGLRQTIDGYGRHEVIIDHHNHGIGLYEMSVEHIANLFVAYRDRMLQLYESDKRLRYVLVFKNFGAAAGASIPHTHSQLIALPVVPDNVLAELQFSSAYYRKEHHCIFCRLIDESTTLSATVFDEQHGQQTRNLNVCNYEVERGTHFVAIKPFASRYEWELHIYPLQHQADFLHLDESKANDFAQVLKNSMARLEAVLGGVQYNYFMHTVPHNEEEANVEQSYHWHLEICPRTSIPTGFELGSGLFVNTVSPEDAVQRLRDVKL